MNINNNHPTAMR